MSSEFEWLKQNEELIRKTARNEEVCWGCGKPKDKGTPLCWDCFKYRKDVTPFKYFDGSLSQWLEQIKKTKTKTPERKQ